VSHPTDEEKAALRARGWHTWYNEEYWVNPDTITDPKIQDYTNYGMSFEEALKWEAFGRPKFKPIGFLP